MLKRLLLVGLLSSVSVCATAIPPIQWCKTKITVASEWQMDNISFQTTDGQAIGYYLPNSGSEATPVPYMCQDTSETIIAVTSRGFRDIHEFTSHDPYSLNSEKPLLFPSEFDEQQPGHTNR